MTDIEVLGVCLLGALVLVMLVIGVGYFITKATTLY